jgi:large subunit ribosomal protein L23
MNINRVIIKPIITEKTLNQVQKNVYVFQVNHRASKGLIKQAVEKLFDVKVCKVNTVTITGKVKKTGRRRLPKKQSNIKKAFVFLAKDQKIDLFEEKA